VVVKVAVTEVIHVPVENDDLDVFSLVWSNAFEKFGEGYEEIFGTGSDGTKNEGNAYDEGFVVLDCQSVFDGRTIVWKIVGRYNVGWGVSVVVCVVSVDVNIRGLCEI